MSQAEQKTVNRRWQMLRRVVVALALAGVLVVVALYGIVAWVSSRRLPEELVAPPSLLGPDSSSTPAQRGESIQPIVADSYPDYLKARQRREPALAATLDLYRELVRRYDEEKIQQTFQHAMGSWRTGEPLPPALIDWLEAHASFLDLARRFAESDPPLPRPSRADRIAGADIKKENPPFHALMDKELLLLSDVAKTLSFQGRRVLVASDPAGAERAARAVVRLARILYGDASLLGRLIGFGVARSASRLIIDLVAQAPADWRASPETVAMLDALARDCSGRAMAVRALEDQFLEFRATVVKAANSGSWKAPVFGWYNMDQRLSGCAIKIGGLEIPPYHAYAVFATFAILNKHYAPENLRDYDAAWKKIIVASRSDYPTLLRQKSELEVERLFFRPGIRKRFNFLPVMFSPNTLGPIVQGISADVMLNLARAALRRRENPTHWPSPDETPAPDSPWLDPFNNHALHIAPDSSNPAATTDTATRLWSVGPDLEDQHGELLYDPTNGTVSAGDISILIP